MELPKWLWQKQDQVQVIGLNTEGMDEEEFVEVLTELLTALIGHSSDEDEEEDRSSLPSNA